MNHRRDIVILAALAAAVPLAQWAWWALLFGNHSFNDFHDYWLAGKLVLDGRSPYDLAALRDVARAEHLEFLVGGGYSYPLPFAVAMVPFALLPFAAAVVAFLGLSIAAFGVTVAAWIAWAHGFEPETRRRRFALALVAGAYPPVLGSVAFGQANLLLFPALGAGAALALSLDRPRAAAGGVLLGLAAIVKLVPVVLLVPLVLGRRRAAAAGIVLGAAGAFVAAVVLAPHAAAGSSGLAALFDPDAFYSNQSLNGFVSRLVEPSERTLPLWPGAFDPRPAMLALTAALGAATLAVLWLRRNSLRDRRGLALATGFALVAAIAGAPKNSFWNESFALVAVGLLLAVEAPDLRLGRLPRSDLALLATWAGATGVWTLVWAFPVPRDGGPAPAWAITLIESASLYGLVALWLVFARRIAAAATADAPAPDPAASIRAAAQRAAGPGSSATIS